MTLSPFQKYIYSIITQNDFDYKLFFIKQYKKPTLDASAWHLKIILYFDSEAFFLLDKLL